METTDWNRTIETLPGAHLLQTGEWARLKSGFGWAPHHRIWPGPDGRAAAAAVTLVRRIPMGGLAARIAVAYVPKGPLLDWANAGLRKKVLADLVADARRKGALLLKIDPEVVVGTGEPGGLDDLPAPVGVETVLALRKAGWIPVEDQVQYRNTVVIDLRPDEETLLERMKQKTRYNVRLAERRGVTIRPGTGADFDLLYRMYAETSVRDGFVIRDERYYKTLWKTLLEAGMLDPLVAEVDGDPVAAAAVARFGGTAIYLHGMSTGSHREKMPNHLLQWEAMRRARAAGCERYDLWGAPEQFEETDPLWGVYRFKEGFGGQVVRFIGAWDYPVRPFWYRIYTNILPKILDRMRGRGRAKTRETLAG
ncbi:MAG TPA: peptidoglycan bridge formation glycyltransferase FemA/FemB family protein [Anaerolineales bacterium]|nr:peptidoglycan bridge formation glycyltransferase FemA/FemB family protein [Anaerolineales bacterium]